MKRVLLAAVAMTALVSSASFAQYNDNRRDGDARQSDRGAGDRDGRRDDNDLGARSWSRGDQLSREYRQPRNIHYGWQASGLRRPPRGHQWMLVGNQFLLVSNRNGAVVEVAFVPRRGEGRGYGYGGDRDELWRLRYKRSYTYNDDVAYAECRNQPDPGGVFAGAVIGGLLGNAAAGRGDRGGATVAGVIAGGAIGAALTNKLDCGDRSYAYRSYSDGFNGGRPNVAYRWENPQTRHRGEMRVIDYYNDEDRFHCAVFVQTAYIGNRREEARGRACQQPNGTWAIID